MNCYTIGLTGGIASGKTSVSNNFEALGCNIIDADVVARVVVEPNSEGLTMLTKAFGSSILSEDNSLDRAKLKNLVFKDNKKLKKLNSILHPLIKQKIINEIEQVKERFCIVVIPLLCESDQYDWLDRILVVDVKPETQLKRLLRRDNVTEELAIKMMLSQCNREKRLLIADDVINNEQSFEDLDNAVKSLFRLYNSL